ncbi:MAG: hypothetical protein ACI4NG_05335 [Candidatus Gallimonas sp.]
MEEEITEIPSAEAIEYAEFKRVRRETEISIALKKLTVDASRRETDKTALKRACDSAVRLKADGVLVSPVNVAAARRLLPATARLCCLVGGTGESLIAVKKTEAKRAARQGAKEIRLIPCYSALRGGLSGYLKREVKRVRRAVKKCAFVVSLDDRTLGAEEIACGVRAAAEGGADGVSVRGETDALLRALEVGGEKLKIDCSGVENAEQFRLLVKAGASRAATGNGDKIAEELYGNLTEPATP